MTIDGFQAAGEVCGNCRDRWEEAGKPLIKLVNLPNSTMVYRQKVAVCPYCDGPIRDVAVAAEKAKDKDDAPDS